MEVIRHFTTVEAPDMYGGVELKTELKYYRSDPLAVTMVFENYDGSEVEWQVSRDMLREGLTCEVGQGDISFWPIGRDHMAIFFETTAATVTIATTTLQEFLVATETLVPFGDEEALVLAGFEDWLEDHLC